MKELDLDDFTLFNEEEKTLLKTIYHTRMRLFLTAFSILFIMGLFYGQRIDHKTKEGFDFTFGSDKREAIISRLQMKGIGMLLLEIPIISVGLYVLSTRINCLKKDINDGKKYRVYYTIIRKQSFPLTDQYFVSLQDPDYLHHEVDVDRYSQYSENDLFQVYFSRYARYAFNKNGSFTMM